MKTKKEQKRKGGIYTTKKDPKTGEKISYAVERILTILTIKKRLLEKGFTIEGIYPSIFYPFYIFNRMRNMNTCKVTENVLKKVPVVNYLSGSYTIIGMKRGWQ